MDVEFSGGKAYVSDYYGTYLKILDASTGALLDQIGLTYGPYKVPSTGVAVDPATGNIYILSWDLDKVFEYSPDGDTLIRSFGSTGSGDGQFQKLQWDLDVIDGTLYVVDAKLSRISVFGLDGTFVGKWGTKGEDPCGTSSPPASPTTTPATSTSPTRTTTGCWCTTSGPRCPRATS